MENVGFKRNEKKKKNNNYKKGKLQRQSFNFDATDKTIILISIQSLNFLKITN